MLKLATDGHVIEAILIEPLLDIQPARLVPALKCVVILLNDFLLALWPAHPLRLALLQDAHHLLRNRQLGIDRRCEGVD